MRRGAGPRTVLLVVVAALSVVLMGAALTSTPDPASPPVAAGSSGPPERPVAALFVGDSYTAGAGAGSAALAWSCRAAAELDWICNRDAQGGTGFVSDGRSNTPTFSPLIDRLPATAERYLADVVVVDAGRNDRAADADTVVEAAADYLATARERWPAATLVIVLPTFLTQVGTDPTDTWQATVDAGLRALAVQYEALVVDPRGEGWVTDPVSQQLLDADGVHPNDAGHVLLAERFVADVRQAGLADVPVTDDGPPGR